jgi:hypothetical protein
MKTAAQRRADGGGKTLTNERTHPYLVEIRVAAAPLDIALNRQIIEFHKSRHIQLRHGRTIFRDGETHYRWCFADSTTARAFIEQFGGRSTTLEQIAHARGGAADRGQYRQAAGAVNKPAGCIIKLATSEGH